MDKFIFLHVWPSHLNSIHQLLILPADILTPKWLRVATEKVVEALEGIIINDFLSPYERKDR